mmetsp:Transcript_91714/g.255373  ORF Transcript_91714/g.255373 Transcript_91714/m.255373 type:complete len:221 (+) Transcript_91714:468-1130(+)
MTCTCDRKCPTASLRTCSSTQELFVPPKPWSNHKPSTVIEVTLQQSGGSLIGSSRRRTQGPWAPRSSTHGATHASRVSLAATSTDARCSATMDRRRRIPPVARRYAPMPWPRPRPSHKRSMASTRPARASGGSVPWAPTSSSKCSKASFVKAGKSSCTRRRSTSGRSPPHSTSAGASSSSDGRQPNGARARDDNFWRKRLKRSKSSAAAETTPSASFTST